jgi:type II secretory pathway component PulJ
MLNNDAKGGSVVLELLVGLVLIAGVAFGIYHVQHPQMTQQQEISASMQQ